MSWSTLVVRETTGWYFRWLWLRKHHDPYFFYAAKIWPQWQKSEILYCLWVCAGLTYNLPPSAILRDQTSTQQDDNQSSRKVTPQAAAKRRSRPPLRYTEDFQTPRTVQLDVIGVVRSPYKERFGTPRQPNITESTLGNKQQPARIELFEGSRFELGLRGLAEFEYCWVISFFHLNQGFNPLVTPPRGPRKKQGVFATRSPHRPNSIGLSCIQITGVDEKNGIIHLLGVDLLDGTAVLDIKPYVPYCDAFPDAKAGWLDNLKEDMKAPDILGYHPPPAHLMRPLTPPGVDTSSVREDGATCDENEGN